MFRLDNWAFRVKWLGLSAGLLAVIGLVLASAPAWAVGGNVFEKSFGGPCTGAGGACEPGQFANAGQQLKEPSGVAVNEDTGDVYVADKGNNRVEEFDATGTTILGEFNGAGAASGPLEKPEGIAIDNSGNPSDPSDHDVYVIDTGHQTVDKFAADGAYLGQFKLPKGSGGQSEELKGVAVDNTGTVWVYQHNAQGAAEVDRFSNALSNESMSSFLPGCGSFETAGLAVDSEGNLYVNCYTGESTIKKLTSSGQVLIGVVKDGSPRAVAVNTGNDVYVDDGASISEFNEAASCTAPAPCGTIPAESLIETFGEGHLIASEGIAVNSTTGDLYATDAATGTVAMFFAPPPLPVPTVQIKQATELQSDGDATLNAIVNPNGVAVTSCEFEYAAAEELAVSATFKHSVPCSSPQTVSEANPLTGASETIVSARISGPPLRPGNLIVSYRLKIGFAEIEGKSTEQTEAAKFQTAPFVAPIVDGQPASAVTQSTATLNATIETDVAVVNYHFEYGTSTAYGQIAPIPDSVAPITSEPVHLTQPVAGLQPGTTYHYRLVASSPGGTEVEGPDETFTTLPIPGPEVATGGAGGVGVGTATVSGTVDPHGSDTQYLFEYGTSTAYGSSWPSVLVDMGSLEGPQPVSVSIPNLLPGTTYHYRLIAVNAGGAGYGPDMTFTTGEYPPSVIQQPPLLTAPGFTFPKEEGTTTSTKALTSAQKLAAALKVCHRDKKKAKRAACEKAAHSKFGPAKKKVTKKK